MSKPKNTDKVINDLHRMMEAQNFSSVKDLQDFMATMVGQKIPEFPNEILSGPERAEDLIFDARSERNFQKRWDLIHEAIDLDPNCISAWNYMGEIEPHPLVSLVMYEKAVAIGRKKFDAKFIKQNKGHFWMIHETRPFITALVYVAQRHQFMGNIAESIVGYEEILMLNENDNTGVRDPLSVCLLHISNYKKYEQIRKKYEDDYRLFPNLTNALYLFLTQGPSAEANKQLKLALTKNKYVAKKLLAKTKAKLTGTSYTIGDQDEAELYCYLAFDLWREKAGALEWLKEVGK
jgi:tetratricopeptide (TPR) repeat protein